MSGLTFAAALAIAYACAPLTAPGTILAVMQAESGFRTDASNVNRNGTVDLGIAQINSANWLRLGLTAETALDPCRSVAAAERVLIENYHPASDAPEAKQAALRVALAAYNAGPRGGPDLDYVHKVQAAAARVIPELRVEGVPPSPSLPAAPVAKADPPPAPLCAPAWDAWALASCSPASTAKPNQEARTQ